MKLKYILLSFIFLGIIPCVYSCEKSNMKDSQKPPEQEEELKVGSDLQQISYQHTGSEGV